MLNRIRSTVTQALPGNPITKDYDIHSQRASAGPGLLWKVFDGQARSTKQVRYMVHFSIDCNQPQPYSNMNKGVTISL